MIESNVVLVVGLIAIIYFAYANTIYKRQRDWQRSEYIKLVMKYNQLINMLNLAGMAVNTENVKLNNVENVDPAIVETFYNIAQTLTNLKQVPIDALTNQIKPGTGAEN